MRIVSTIDPPYENIQIEPVGKGSYKLTMIVTGTVAQFLKWSDRLEPEFMLIRRALQRPYTRMGGNYSEPIEIPIPNFVTVRAIAQRLATMARCHLLQGKPEEALRDLTLMHDLFRILVGGRPITLVGAMINVSVAGLYVSTMADGLRWQAWREPQLAGLEEQLQQFNLLPPVKQGFETDWRVQCHVLESVTPERLMKAFKAPRKVNSWNEQENWVLARLMPRGWACQNNVIVASFYPNVLATLDPASQIVFPEKADDFARAASAAFSAPQPYSFMAAMMIPNYTRAARNTAQNQTMVNQGIIACALERYHLAHGEYPETLDALAPQFITAIPHDVIGGKPLHYRRAADGAFTLYSVGWNGRDDGGVPGKSITEGDWVWLAFL
jgi:hypothetical protein